MQHLVEEAEDAMRKARLSNGDTGMLFTGGKDSMIMLWIWRNRVVKDSQPSLLVVDTYNQFDEIYDFRDQISEDWDLEFDVRANEQFLDKVINNDDDPRGFAWDGPKTEECCGALKIDVIADFIQDGYNTLISGRRAADVGGELDISEEKRNPLPHKRVNPLANWSDAHVEAFIKKHSIPLPTLYYNGWEHTDCVDCVSKGEEGDDWSGVSAEQKERLRELRDMGYM